MKRFVVLVSTVIASCADPSPTPAVDGGAGTLDAPIGTIDGPIATGDARPIDAGPPLTVDRALCDAINAYRADHGLAPVPVSAALTQVARFHVVDLTAHGTGAAGCNLHSWSVGDPRWTGCCYTADHAQAQCMWRKPQEIAAYASSGYEIAAGGGGAITPSQAVSLWDGSSGHREVVLNAGQWASRTWRGMGCAIETGYAVVWFGER